VQWASSCRSLVPIVRACTFGRECKTTSLILDTGSDFSKLFCDGSLRKFQHIPTCPHSQLGLAYVPHNQLNQTIRYGKKRV
jgi:hypothetical protein